MIFQYINMLLQNSYKIKTKSPCLPLTQSSSYTESRLVSLEAQLWSCLALIQNLSVPLHCLRIKNKLLNWCLKILLLLALTYLQSFIFFSSPTNNSWSKQNALRAAFILFPHLPRMFFTHPQKPQVRILSSFKIHSSATSSMKSSMMPSVTHALYHFQASTAPPLEMILRY